MVHTISVGHQPPQSQRYRITGPCPRVSTLAPAPPAAPASLAHSADATGGRRRKLSDKGRGLLTEGVEELQELAQSGTAERSTVPL